jgi:hypothetical protein
MRMRRLVAVADPGVGGTVLAATAQERPRRGGARAGPTSRPSRRSWA